MNLRSLNIAYRSQLCFGFLALLVILVGGFGLWQAAQIQDENQHTQTDSIPGIVSSDALALQVARLRIEAVRLQTHPAPPMIATIQQRIDQFESTLERQLATYAGLADQEAEKRLLAEFHSHYNNYQAKLGELIELTRQEVPDIASLPIVMETTTIGSRMNDAAEQLRTLNQETAKQSAEKATTLYERSKTVIITVLSLMIFLTTLLAWRLTHSLAQPIGNALQVARTIAAGDLTQRLDTSGTDEAAQLLQALEQMQGALRDTLERIANSADQLASATEEMSSVMQESSQSLQQQNNEIEMAVTAVTEMSQAVDEVADNASSTSMESKAAANNARKGQQQLDDTLAAMGKLTDNVLGASSEAKALAEHTHNISQVLDVIRSVAEQTNLLALNAAIEAARAGEAGRGFAVVADEVRALAHRTSESTTEIEAMIATIQAGTGHTVEALLNSADQARLTQEQATAANQALAAINQSVAGIDERNLVIASAAEQQAQVAREVDRNLVRIRDLSIQSATGAEQTHVASQELSRLATDLNGMIRQFKL